MPVSGADEETLTVTVGGDCPISEGDTLAVEASVESVFHVEARPGRCDVVTSRDD